MERARDCGVRWYQLESDGSFTCVSHLNCVIYLFTTMDQYVWHEDNEHSSACPGSFVLLEEHSEPRRSQHGGYVSFITCIDIAVVAAYASFLSVKRVPLILFSFGHFFFANCFVPLAHACSLATEGDCACPQLLTVRRCQICWCVHGQREYIECYIR